MLDINPSLPVVKSKKPYFISIGILVIIILVIAWNYRSNISNLFKNGENTERENSLTTTLPPLTEAQKLEASKAPEGMVYVPEGEYLSGIPKEIKFSERRPLTTITLKSFYIDRLEVTNMKFSEFIKQNPEWQKGSKNREFLTGLYLREFTSPTEYPSGLGNYPVVWVSWHAAKAYCENNDKRLPTSAEWEKAARGVDARIYPWGNEFDGSKANFCDKSCPAYFRDNRFDDGYAYTAPVGSYPKGASPYGVLDMSGNVKEWVSDWFDPSGLYDTKTPTRDPTGSVSGTEKVLRGGSFSSSDAQYGTALYLFGAFPPRDSALEIGFRCATDVK